jgi:hypothetical protein
MLKENPEKARAIAERIVRNTYRTLMTRGQKGCYVYCVDAETNEYFKQAGTGVGTPSAQTPEPYPGLPLRVLPLEDVRPYENSVPVFDLAMAAGRDFSEEQAIEDQDWVELPESFRPQSGLFVTRVVGESMNRRIPNGSWCLFKTNPAGTREGKVVIVQHRDIQDAETGTRCTVKLYSSEKRATEDGWRHERIVLRPDSSQEGYRPIVLEPDEARELRVIGELVAILG